MTNRDDRIKIFQDTQNIIKENKELNDSIFGALATSHIYKDGTLTSDGKNIIVSKKSTIDAALDTIKKYPSDKVAILNFASATNPGGGVTSGSSAQEECICRCTTLFNCLNDTYFWKYFYIPNRTEGSNLHSDDILYINNIYIIKDGEYNLLEEPKKISVITCAAPNLNERGNNAYNIEPTTVISVSDNELFELHFSRAVAIFESALENYADRLILGAFGCGAFKNDPTIVASAYKNAMKIYGKKFKSIEFAIYSGSGDSTNYDAFFNVLK